MNSNSIQNNYISEVSQTIYNNYKLLINEYLEITKRGKEHFENRTYTNLFDDALKRYKLYGTVVQNTIQSLRKIQKKKWRLVAILVENFNWECLFSGNEKL